MSKSGVNRRQFLGTGGRAMVGGGAATSLSGLVVPGQAWAEGLAVLKAPTADILLRVCRVMFPHDGLGDTAYMTCVEGLDAKAANSDDLAILLGDGAAELGDDGFLDLDEAGQVKVLTAQEGTSFFQAIHGHMITALYNNPKVWAHFGYEGASFPLGGYLERGFNDINWLPKS